MSATWTRTILWGKLASHPAVVAWRAILPEAPDPERIEVLRKHSKSVTYRLVGGGEDGQTIVALRSRAEKAQIERLVYERVLPHLPIPTPRYYGFREEFPDSGWLFLEDVGDERYSATDPAHLSLAARWVGALHVRGAAIPAARDLPDGGPARYLEHLRLGRETVRAWLANPLLAGDEVVLLERLVCDLDRIENAWGVLERACTYFPATLVHGDFRPKNAFIRGSGGAEELVAIDWEMAGWGVPAIDLVEVDVTTYWSVVKSSWPGVRLAHVRRLRAVGEAFRWLAAVRWAAPELRGDSKELLLRPVEHLRAAQRSLADAVRWRTRR